MYIIIFVLKCLRSPVCEILVVKKKKNVESLQNIEDGFYIAWQLLYVANHLFSWKIWKSTHCKLFITKYQTRALLKTLPNNRPFRLFGTVHCKNAKQEKTRELCKASTHGYNQNWTKNVIKPFSGNLTDFFPINKHTHFISNWDRSPKCFCSFM